MATSRTPKRGGTRASRPSGPSAAERADARKVAAGYKASDFERPSVTCDMVILAPRPTGPTGPTAASTGTGTSQRLDVLLIQRGKPPYQGFWATPGGFVDMHEDLADGARRELQEETGVTVPVRIEQVGVYGKPDRDPRTRVISIAWVALLNEEALASAPAAADDARNVGWFGADKRHRPQMAFDHNAILDDALTHVRRRIMHTALASPLLPSSFTARQLAEVYSVLLGKPVEAGKLRLALSRNGVLKATRKKGHWQFKPVYW